MALKVAHDCVVQDEADAVRVVFASRHGELRRTTDILRAISAGEPVSPTAFSLSVLNAMTGVFGIARGDRSAASAISAGAETLGYALLEAYAQYTAQPESPVLLVYADEPADPAYGTIEEDVQGGAIAILVNGATAAGQLVCTLSSAGEPAVMAAAEVGHVDEPGHVVKLKPHYADEPGAANAEKSFATQDQALLHCLETGQPAFWPGAGTAWHWSLA
jgi:hypothetical protein